MPGDAWAPTWASQTAPLRAAAAAGRRRPKASEADTMGHAGSAVWALEACCMDCIGTTGAEDTAAGDKTAAAGRGGRRRG
jgi:hypothetical protein